jgi:hypothetical protein
MPNLKHGRFRANLGAIEPKLIGVDDLEGFRSDETRPRAKKNERAGGRDR